MHSRTDKTLVLLRCKISYEAQVPSLGEESYILDPFALLRSQSELRRAQVFVLVLLNFIFNHLNKVRVRRSSRGAKTGGGDGS